MRDCRARCPCLAQGYNAAIIAYGQTGTGKTYTMEGALEVGGMNMWLSLLAAARQDMLASMKLEQVGFGQEACC